jgi:uncharacterized BrkB/YihY/UPF0761 family membrane protein
MQKSADTYGEFAAVISLLAWLSIHALINLVGAELNAASSRLRTEHTTDTSVAPVTPAA